ncbi:FAD/NAD(P)-binding protein [Corynebacterium bovis]|uniref:FAD/NAD(P)-binding protein n=1 Tax=Corynebacterium bovis TaxID=36808 RepID=UPI00244D0955|nr:FAD/NAD(P)-binding protein [Corynebacterium bovis]MDH2456728.1 FAD/NAD(P)-binding protein [Corynebacterium bovis]
MSDDRSTVSAPGPAPLTVAVVGAGPRGLWAAECLADEARAHRVPVAVDVVDDAPPGAGAAYGPEQPDHWTLNVDSRIVRTGVGTFADWARRHGAGVDAGGAGAAGDGNAAGDAGQPAGDAVPFPPRSVVGDFLADSWRALAADPDRAPWFTLRHVRRRVRDVRQVAGGWSVDGVTYDDVLLATGHAATWPGALPRDGERRDRADGARDGDRDGGDRDGGDRDGADGERDGDRRDGRVRTVGVYPPDGLRSIPAGARVLVRGAALTFIDAALELTVGRGGRFVGTGTGLTYRPGGGEPAVIRPVCRSGRFMEVKPDPRGRLAGIRDDAAARRARAAVVTCADLAGMTAALEGYAVALLDAAGAGGGDGGGSGDSNTSGGTSDNTSDGGAALRAVRAVVAGTDAGPAPDDGDGTTRDDTGDTTRDTTRNAGRDAVAALRRSRDIAVGAAPPGAAWAVGQAFRQLYPAIVGRVADRTRPPLVGFGALARTLERVAFGPTPDNASRLLALIDAGVVDCADLADPTAVDRALAGGAAPGDAATDAVVAAHGAAAAPGTTSDAPIPATTSDAPAPATADVVVDAVLPPAGIVPGTLLAETLARHGVDAAEVSVDPDGAVAGLPGLAVAGRDTEHLLPGADTLSRDLHDVVPRWARGVVTRHRTTAVRDPRAAATVPLTGRLEPWAVELLEDPGRCDRLLVGHGSPVNVLRPAPVLRAVDELIAAGRDCGVDVRVFMARKANKGLAFVDAVRDAGHGVDVAGEAELRQVLARGVPGERIILSAAVKPAALVDLAVRAGVVVSADGPEEADRIADAAARAGTVARIAPRLAPDPGLLPATRFGARAGVWGRWLRGGVDAGARGAGGAAGGDAGARGAGGASGGAVAVVGVHVHLHGYSASDRRVALGEALGVVDAARQAGHAPTFVDLGGGVPMSYVDDPAQWAAFLRAREAVSGAGGVGADGAAGRAAADGTAGRAAANVGARADAAGATHADASAVTGERFTWKDDPLRTIYPFHQSPTRGDWLRDLLTGPVEVRGVDGGTAGTTGATTDTPADGEAVSAADALVVRGLRLHLEPGRSVLDGAGLTLARVAFLKERSDGVPLVGLEMNRTQCRTTADDLLVDPVLVPCVPAGASAPDRGPGYEGFLVGAYCIEDEVIVRRRIRFPRGISVGDVIALPNTGGYFMHILESASHQIPLARNVVAVDAGGPGRLDFRVDPVDER